MVESDRTTASIFVSYSHHDDDFCVKLVQDLRQALSGKYHVWYDSSGGLRGGDDWWRKIVDSLQACNIFLVILSPNSMASPWVNDEIDLAWKFKNAPRGMLIIPILYQPCTIREDLDTRQIISFLPSKPYETAFNELLAALQEPERMVQRTQPLPHMWPTPALPVFSRTTWATIALGVLAVIVAIASTVVFLSSRSTQLSPSENISYGVQPCPNSVKPLLHWKPIIGIPIGFGEDDIIGVACGHLKGDSSLQALVTTRGAGSGGFLSLYIYDNIVATKPTQLFTLDGLADGSAQISNVNTIITAEVDADSTINMGKANAQLTPDLCREFEWSIAESNFVQVSFPSIFPDMTRFQAESDQNLVSHGKDTWKLDVMQTAKHAAASLLKWTATSATLVSGGGAHDDSAVVSVKDSGIGGNAVKITLIRLRGNASSGIWEAAGISSDHIAITQPEVNVFIHSPLQLLVGDGHNIFPNTTSQITVLDHLYNNVGQTNTNGQSTPIVNYHSTFPGQEGALALLVKNGSGSIIAANMIKVILA